MPWWVTPLASVIAAILSGGGIAKLLVARQEGEKVAAETDSIEANVTDLNWQRFQREINRLVKRVEALEGRCRDLEGEVRECHLERSRLEAENIKLKSANEMRGEARQRAAQIVAADRLEGHP